MSYNPDDGLIYYLRDDQTLVSFDPEDPDIVTVIGSYSQNFDRITINGSGEAYCLDYAGDFYRISTTDASAVFVGNIPNASAIAFDQDNDELYCAVYTNSRQVICAVDDLAGVGIYSAIELYIPTPAKSSALWILQLPPSMNSAISAGTLRYRLRTCSW